MSERVFVFRPEPGFSETIAAGVAMGLDMLGCPLFAIEPVEWELPAGKPFDGILLGSANALRCGGPKLGALRHLPVYAVGRATARAATQAGFEIADCGAGGLQALIDGLAERGLRLLRLGGAERIALRVPADTDLVERVVYRAQARELEPEVAEALSGGGIALLHSARAGEQFAAQCDAHAIARSRLRIAALAPRIADSVGAGWAEVAIAQEPDARALLAMAHDMCNNPR